jgi:hypothetical protein
VEVSSDRFLLDQMTRKHLEQSGPLVRSKRLSYSSLIAEYQTATMALHGLARFGRFVASESRMQHCSIQFAADVTNAIRQRMADEACVLNPPKCLVALNFEPAANKRAEQYLQPFDVEDSEYSPRERKLITFHRTMASVKDFYMAFDEGQAGMHNTRVVEQVNIRQLKSDVFQLICARLIDACYCDCSEYLCTDLIQHELRRARAEARAQHPRPRPNRLFRPVFAFVVPQFDSIQWRLSPARICPVTYNLRQRVKKAAKARKREMIRKDRDYQAKVVIQMREDEQAFEFIQQPLLNCDSSRLTPYHKIDESAKRRYLRPYSKARLHPLVVARDSGLTLLASQYPKPAEQNERRHRVMQTGVYGKRVYYEKSTIQGWGLFALEHLGIDSLICEYAGDVVRSRVADKREKMYLRQGLPHMYLFRIRETDWIVDATARGGKARFLNHSCNPNCRANDVRVGNRQLISFYAIRNIKPHEELTFDYMLEKEQDPSKWETCYCGAKQCTGYMNDEDKDAKKQREIPVGLTKDFDTMGSD